MLPAAFQPFVKDAPFCVMARATLESLFSGERLDELFRTTAHKQYTRELLFSQLVELMTTVVLQQQPSVLAAYRKGIGNITVSDQSVYNKLDGMELGVSAALVHDSAARLAPVIDELKARRPSWLPGYRVRILDGNHLSATERRLVALRDAWDSPLPGKVLAVLDQQTGLATDVFLTPDGHAQERSLLDEVLAVVAARDLWIADRNFCTLKFLFRIREARAAFVIRQHGQVEGKLVGKRRYVGRTDTGAVYEQDIELSYEGQRKKFRRVSVVLDQPTREGDTEIRLLTNLPQDEATALVVAELYRRRWTIEGRFLEGDGGDAQRRAADAGVPQGGPVRVLPGVAGVERGRVAQGRSAGRAWPGGGGNAVGLLCGAGHSAGPSGDDDRPAGPPVGTVPRHERGRTGGRVAGDGARHRPAALPQIDAEAEETRRPQDLQKWRSRFDL